MLKQEEVHFIETFLIKGGEHLEVPAITKDVPFIDIKIIKHTERTRRMTGIFTIAVNVEAEEPGMKDEELLCCTRKGKSQSTGLSSKMGMDGS